MVLYCNKTMPNEISITTLFGERAAEHKANQPHATEHNTERNSSLTHRDCLRYKPQSGQVDDLLIVSATSAIVLNEQEFERRHIYCRNNPRSIQQNRHTPAIAA